MEFLLLSGVIVLCVLLIVLISQNIKAEREILKEARRTREQLNVLIGKK
jgi:heme exporter protein D